MGTRSVRLDEDTEKTLAKLTRMTGLSVSEVLKRGVLAYRAKALKETARKPYDIYRQLDLGKGGYARAPARDAKAAVADIIKKKHGR
ncbi:MAG: ribbon-helix-helix protein, CopG family [Gammaproteobacteria bacterium]|nr:ribbon-helix-helix protein, CopG family [Gammaproteobacteria bacterium]